MATTPKLNLTDVPFVGDVDKPDDYGIASKDSVPVLTKASRAIVTAKAGYEERQTAVSTASQNLASFCRGLAEHIMAIRRQFIRQSDGKVDWRGQSNAYKRFVSLNVYEPMFGTRPEGVDRSKWNRESGYGSFKTTLDRAITAYVDEQSAAAKLQGLGEDDEQFIPVGALSRPTVAGEATPDSKALVESARASKVIRKADGPNVQELLNTAETALRMMVEYGDPEQPSLAPGLLKLTPNEAAIWQTRLVHISAHVRTVARIVEAKLADAAKVTDETETEPEGDLVEATA